MDAVAMTGDEATDVPRDFSTVRRRRAVRSCPAPGARSPDRTHLAPRPGRRNHMATKTSIDQLNSFLRGEMSAVETYRMALDKLDQTSTARDELLVNLKSHQDRVMALQDAIIALGGQPAQGSGPWGTFAKAVEGAAKVLGEKATVAALEEGEDHGLKDYKSDISELSPDCQRIVDQLVVQQQQTHDRLSALKRRL
jgi:hypothetical protein